MTASNASDGAPETLENLVNVIKNQDSVIQTYYTDDNGEVVTLSLYDISATDPADILGMDVLNQHNDNAGGTSGSDADDDRISEEDETLEEKFDEAVMRRLERLRRRYYQHSGDSDMSASNQDN